MKDTPRITTIILLQDSIEPVNERDILSKLKKHKIVTTSLL